MTDSLGKLKEFGFTYPVHFTAPTQVFPFVSPLTSPNRMELNNWLLSSKSFLDDQSRINGLEVAVSTLYSMLNQMESETNIRINTIPSLVTDPSQVLQAFKLLGETCESMMRELKQLRADVDMYLDQESVIK